MWKLGIINVFAGVMAITCTPALGQEVKDSGSYSAKEDICKSIETEARIKIGVKPGVNQDVLGSQDEEHTLTGTIASCGDGVLFIKPQESGEELVRVPLEELEWMQISQGKSRYTKLGSGIGLMVGLVVGLSSMREDSQSEEWLAFDYKDEYQNAARVVGGALGGLVVGAIVGSFFSHEKWEKVYEVSSLSFLGNHSTGEYQVALGCSF